MKLLLCLTLFFQVGDPSEYINQRISELEQELVQLRAVKDALVQPDPDPDPVPDPIPDPPPGRCFAHIRTWATPYAATDRGTPVPQKICDWYDTHYDMIMSAEPWLWNTKEVEKFCYLNYNNVATYQTFQWQHWTNTFNNREDVYIHLQTPHSTLDFKQRVPYHGRWNYYGDNRWFVNVTMEEVQQWVKDYAQHRINLHGHGFHSIMMDNGFDRVYYGTYGDGTDLVEVSNENNWKTWREGSNKCLENVRSVVDKPCVVNIGSQLSDGVTKLAEIMGICETEVWINPTHTVDHVEQRIKRLNSWTMPVLLEVRRSLQGLSVERHRMLALAGYYLYARDGDAPTYFYYGGEGFRGALWDESLQRSTNWFPAMEFNVGGPLGDIERFTGVDPDGKGKYTVYMREYENAFVLFRPKTRYDSKFDGIPVNISLPQPVRLLNSENQTVALLSETPIRNAEGMILVK
jgi:hypothetical protein